MPTTRSDREREHVKLSESSNNFEYIRNHIAKYIFIDLVNINKTVTEYFIVKI